MLPLKGVRFPAILLVAAAVFTSSSLGREIHVAIGGNDSSDGTQGTPYRTMGKAAVAAQPGDTVTVHGGTYREWVRPARGGTDEAHRILYRAAPGEDVFVKGSERVATWVKQDEGDWQAEVPNSLFGDYNPFALKVSGGWLNYGQWHTRGDVYLNGEAYYEKASPEEVGQQEGTWHARVDGDRTMIRANFGAADPNKEIVEINVRECLFMPEVTGLQYITVDGFHFAHAAANWAPPTLTLQTGAVGPRMGKHWIIENCTITNARCVGIILGQAPGVNYDDIDAYGDHIVRNNVIRRCGQAGIAGQKGATRSLICGNLIEDTNYRKEFGGWETAAVKFHNSVDTVISGNLIRRVFREQQGAFGIWIDFGNQGVRISRNLIYDTDEATVFLEMNHGPTVVDGNILIGQPVRSNSEATVFAHNLFVDCGYDYRPDVKRRSQYFQPHTTLVAGRKSGTAQDDKWFHNVFVRKGLDRVKDAPGYQSDYNLFLEGARPSSFGDRHSLVDPQDVRVSVVEEPLGASVRFLWKEPFQTVQGPRVDATLVGVFPTVGQTIEDRYGDPITVDTDFLGRRFASPIVGPLAEPQSGENVVPWLLKKPK